MKDDKKYQEQESKDIANINEILKDNTSNELVIVYRNIRNIYETSPKQEFYGIMTKKELELAQKHGIGFCPRESKGAQGDGIITDVTYFIKLPEECPAEIVEKLHNEQKKLTTLKKEIASGKNDKKYNEPIVIEIPVYDTHDLSSYFDSKHASPIRTIKFETTQKELIMHGIIPDNFGRTETLPSQVTPKYIAEKVIENGIGKLATDKARNFLFGRNSDKPSSRGEK